MLSVIFSRQFSGQSDENEAIGHEIRPGRRVPALLPRRDRLNLDLAAEWEPRSSGDVAGGSHGKLAADPAVIADEDGIGDRRGRCGNTLDFHDMYSGHRATREKDAAGIRLAFRPGKRDQKRPEK
jgi:hypothetical protein